jgi:hypothetical protein
MDACMYARVRVCVCMCVCSRSMMHGKWQRLSTPISNEVCPPILHLTDHILR